MPAGPACRGRGGRGRGGGAACAWRWRRNARPGCWCVPRSPRHGRLGRAPGDVRRAGGGEVEGVLCDSAAGEGSQHLPGLRRPRPARAGQGLRLPGTAPQPAPPTGLARFAGRSHGGRSAPPAAARQSPPGARSVPYPPVGARQGAIGLTGTEYGSGQGLPAGSLRGTSVGGAGWTRALAAGGPGGVGQEGPEGACRGRSARRGRLRPLHGAGGSGAIAPGRDELPHGPPREVGTDTGSVDG